VIDSINKVVVAIPDSKPSSGLGHITRTLILLSRFHSARCIYIIVEDPVHLETKLSIPFPRFSRIEHLPKSVFSSQILLIFDSYDCSQCAVFFQRALALTTPSRLNVLSVCDTYDQARSMLSYVPCTNLLFPNIIAPRIRPALVDLAESHNRALYDGYKYILLDERTVEAPLSCRLTPGLGKIDIKCTICFGFSSFELTNEFLTHCEAFIDFISRQAPSIQFTLIGKNALSLFKNLGLCEHVFEYHQFMSKPSLIKLYDSSSVFFGSLGYSIWERAFRLLPSFVYPIAVNQRPYVEIGRQLGILCASSDALNNDFNLSESLLSMHCGTLRFRQSILQHVTDGEQYET